MQPTKYPKKSLIYIIDDTPHESEVKANVPFSSATHSSFYNRLAKACLTLWKGEDNFTSREIYTTYLVWKKADKENIDFWKDISDKESIYTPVYLKSHDLWLSKSFMDNINRVKVELSVVQPRIIIPIGKWSLFFLANGDFKKTRATKSQRKQFGQIEQSRGSHIPLSKKDFNLTYEGHVTVFPTYPDIMRMRKPVLNRVLDVDIYRVADLVNKTLTGQDIPPEPNFRYCLSAEEAVKELTELIVYVRTNKPISIDIETKFNKMIDVICFSKDENECFSIMFFNSQGKDVYSLEEEIKIVGLIRKLLLVEEINIVGQGYTYDAQYIMKHWKVLKSATNDTMIGHHVLYSYSKKSLSFLASIYCKFYTQWKGMQNHE